MISTRVVAVEPPRALVPVERMADRNDPARVVEATPAAPPRRASGGPLAAPSRSVRDEQDSLAAQLGSLGQEHEPTGVGAIVPAPAAPEAPGSLAEETALLRDARAALSAGDAARADALLERHASRFPDGLLREEQRVARVAVLCALGRADDARTAVAEFLTRYPRSAYRAHLAVSCGGASH